MLLVRSAIIHFPLYTVPQHGLKATYIRYDSRALRKRNRVSLVPVRNGPLSLYVKEKRGRVQSERRIQGVDVGAVGAESNGQMETFLEPAYGAQIGIRVFIRKLGINSAEDFFGSGAPKSSKKEAISFSPDIPVDT